MAAPERNKKKLGECLVERGLVSADQIGKALEEQKKSGSRLGQMLVDLGFLKEEDLIVTLAQQLNLAHIDISAYRLKSDIIQLIPEKVARRYELLVLEKMGNNCTVAMADPLNVFAIDEVQRLTRCRVEPVICARSALLQVLEKAYKAAPAEPEKAAAAAPESSGRAAAEPRDLSAAGGQEVMELVNEMVRSAVIAQATDIHLEPDEEYVRLRCRVDGFLREIGAYPKDMQALIISRIKVLSGLDISEKRVPQDGRFRFEMENKEIDLRVSTLPTVLGEKVVMRVLDKSMVALDMEKLGFRPDDFEKFNELIHRPFGMILVTGPTSSGKTTTLYSALNTINTVDKNILTVEDPVEYRMKMINQVQVNPRAGLTFAAGLRSFLRQDPDVIMIGEIRDLETAEIAVQAALTGHLVLSTIHTNNAPSTVTRLIDMKIDAFLVASAVVGILAQRLIRKVCADCREAYTASPEMVRTLGLDITGAVQLYRGRGCAACGKSGYRSRIGIYELMVVNDRMRELILRQESAVLISREARAQGMRTLREDGLLKAREGVTSVEEVLRATAEDTKG
ncbi:MAG: Flp pilus assembly complex ATPase component TadA [Candidatus Omnitrophica bacterium]|nr:Flp pilus assembly complex ATPase component TadA [Candidatus Omnitrophota bacterium]